MATAAAALAAAATVTVACALPNGLILDFKGAVPKKFESFLGKPAVRIRGRNSNLDRKGYGLTPNVDAEFMEAWLALNADMEIVKNGFIFVEADTDRAQAHAREKRDVKTSLDPMNQEVKDAKGKAIISPMETEDEADAA